MAKEIDYLAKAKDIHLWMKTIRRNLHRNPELGFDCQATSGIVSTELHGMGVDYYADRRFAQTGVVGRIGSGNAPYVALRADMDAFPLQELYDSDFKSENENITHACGHDAHVTMLLGAAQLLVDINNETPFQGTVFLIFQPSKEQNAGAQHMVQDGALMQAEAIFGLRVTDALPAGTWASKPGTLMTGSALFGAKIKGKGGHGGNPQHTADPILTSASVVSALQSIISRETSPFDTQVISVGMIRGGVAKNTIPDVVEVGGTYRFVDETTYGTTMQRIEEVMNCQAKVHRCSIESFEWETPVYGPLVNKEDAFKFIRGAALKVLKDESKVVTLPAEPGVEFEDFSFYLKEIPGALAYVGCAAPFTDGEVYGVRTDKFVLDEDVLYIGAAIHTALAMEYMANTPSLEPPTSKIPPSNANSYPHNANFHPLNVPLKVFTPLI